MAARRIWSCKLAQKPSHPKARDRIPPRRFRSRGLQHVLDPQSPLTLSNTAWRPLSILHPKPQALLTFPDLTNPGSSALVLIAAVAALCLFQNLGRHEPVFADMRGSVFFAFCNGCGSWQRYVLGLKGFG